jgi:hypothetical protein
MSASITKFGGSASYQFMFEFKIHVIRKPASDHPLPSHRGPMQGFVRRQSKSDRGAAMTRMSAQCQLAKLRLQNSNVSKYHNDQLLGSMEIYAIKQVGIYDDRNGQRAEPCAMVMHPN